MSDDETIVQKQVRLVLERQCRELAELLASKVPAGVGFVLFLADHGPKGNTAYVSSVTRDSAHALVHEWLDRQDANHPQEGWEAAAQYVAAVARVTGFEGEVDPGAVLEHCEKLAAAEVHVLKAAATFAAAVAMATRYTGPRELDGLLEHCKQLAAKAATVQP
jgi:hypothetical protein